MPIALFTPPSSLTYKQWNMQSVSLFWRRWRALVHPSHLPLHLPPSPHPLISPNAIYDEKNVSQSTKRHLNIEVPARTAPTSVSLLPWSSLTSWLASVATPPSSALLLAFLLRVSAPGRGVGGGREGAVNRFSLGLMLCFCTGQFWLPLWHAQSTL